MRAEPLLAASDLVEANRILAGRDAELRALTELLLEREGGSSGPI